MRKAKHSSWLERVSMKATEGAGSSVAFAVACGTILVWIVTGPVFGYSDTWQLVINTGTTVVTFLMVFLIQRAQNKEARALQLKLNEIVAALQGASNRLVNVEDLSEEDLAILRAHYVRLARAAEKDRSIRESHSVDEAEARAQRKRRTRQARRKFHGAGTSRALPVDTTGKRSARGMDSRPMHAATAAEE